MLFAEKMAGGADDDDTILKAFDAFEVNGKIDADMFKHSLMTFGDKFSASEVDNAFGEFLIEDGMIDAVHLKVLWSRRRRMKQNKLLFIKYQSYHRHHLIRISSCHTLQRAKKTKKRNSPQKSNRKDPHDSSISYPIEEAKNVPLQHSFNSFGKWCSFPQELFNVKKTGNAGHAFDQRETTTSILQRKEEELIHRQLLCYS